MKIENIPVNAAAAKVAGIISERQAVQTLNDKASIALNSQMAMGFSISPVLPLKEIGTFLLGSTAFQMPVTLRLDSEPDADAFTLPVDPQISINGKNVIKRRYSAKNRNRGSIKELWNQSDYDITISGVLCGQKKHSLESYLKKLRKYCEAKTSVHITCDILNMLDITRIAIHDYNFPFTKGEENQEFTIKAWSDNSFQLLEERK